MVVVKGKLAPIDMEMMGFGHPVFDLAISRSRLLHAALVKDILGYTEDDYQKSADALWKAQLEAYFEGREIDLDAVNTGIQVLAALEYAANYDDMLEDGAAFIAELLPYVDRLDV